MKTAPHASVTIRRERPDQPNVAALLGELDAYLDAMYPPEANHILGVNALLAPDVTFVVARDADGIAVGTGACRPGPAASGEPYGEIKRMFVAPAARGLRIGERVLATLEDALRNEGRPWALLETGRDQIEALRLYRRCGYAECPPFGGYPDNGLSVFLGKRLA